jgi:hypothetical protein
MSENGKSVDAFFEDVRGSLAGMKKKAEALREKGILHAYPHFKTGTKKMFLNTPTDGCGRRKFIYVGTDEKKQKAALAKIARFYQHERILESIGRITDDLESQERELRELYHKAGALTLRGDAALKDADRPEKKLEGVTAPRRPSARAVTPTV